MKKTLAIVLSIIMIVSTVPVVLAGATVAEGTAGEGITWVLDSDGTLTISGTGAISTSWYEPPWEEYNDSITSIVVEEGITKVPDTAFVYVENLVTVSLPSTLTYFSGMAFVENFALEEIIVAEENTEYKSIDGVLFTEDEKTLVAYPMNKAGEEYTIPASVTTIGKYGFVSNVSLKSLTIPDTVTVLERDALAYGKIDTIVFGNGITEIPENCIAYSDTKTVVISDSVKTIASSAFYGADSLESLIIGSGVETIAMYVFNNPKELSAIHYKGIEEDWKKITIDEPNDAFNNKAVHFFAEDSYKEEKAPTCADGHTEGYFCDECNAYITGEVIAAIDEHAWYNGICDKCGEVCSHIDSNHNEICDVCKDAVPFKEVVLNETDTVYFSDVKASISVKFIPAESGIYVIYSDNGGDNENIDPYVYIYDSNGDLIAADDDDGQSRNFCCYLAAQAGERYLIELCSLNSEVEYDYTVKHIDFTHQPTEDEPYVEINWDRISAYQWYSVEDELTEVTDTNGKAYSYGNETAAYDSENGWTAIPDEAGYYSSATFALSEGDKVAVEFAKVGFKVFGFWDWRIGEGSEGCFENGGVLTYEVEIEADGVYTFYMLSPVAHKIYLVDEIYTMIDGETDAALKNLKSGTEYCCQVTLENGEVLESDRFEYAYKIIHQPTEKESYVELNDDIDAKYQWYSVKDLCAEITDENAEGRYADGEEKAAYNAEDGWTGTQYSGTDQTNFFALELEAGQQISMTLNEEVTHLGIISYNGNSGHWADLQANETVYFTAIADDTYKVFAQCSTEARLRAYIIEYEYTAIDGETDDLYAPSEDGLYACEVTFADGTTEMSDMFEGPHIHTEGEAFTANEKAATCLTPASYDLVSDCLICGKEASRETVVTAPELGHDMVTDEAVSPTCTETGLTEGSHCSRCDDATTAQEVAPALGHDMVTDEAVAPTCTESGLTEGSHCSRCDDATTAQEVAPALGHDMVTDEAVAPSCTETGLTEGSHCSRCDDATTAQETVPALGHDYEAAVTAPTCTKDGFTTYKCKACGDTYIGNTTAATGHIDNDGDYKCDNGCGHEFEKPADDSCDHLCHKDGFLGFIWKIVRFFQKLFRINPVCECGAAHY